MFIYRSLPPTERKSITARTSRQSLSHYAREDRDEPLELPNPDDHHALAAVIVGHCDVFVMQNLQDFPDADLKPYGIETRHPDDFLVNHLPGIIRRASVSMVFTMKTPHLI